ncbi:hypothetical protein AwDysgo_02030 [Bacteroidales bacterium]|nr:hypothetical protein AwDysgo_02030 [Bacteroidales bacterium]
MIQKQFDIRFPAEWEEQSGAMLTWPHVDSDWREIMVEVIPCFVSIAQEIIKREKLLIVCRNIAEVKRDLGNVDLKQIVFREIESNDSWARDHGPISITVNGNPFICDYAFNGWGMKFAANLDNQINKKLYASKAFDPSIAYQSMLHCVLEGGSIESDGCGTLLTSTECLLSDNRNEYKSKEEIGDYLKLMLGIERILWLNHGYLEGDDTDSHIDTLARFCTPQTIAYVQCLDMHDPHFEALHAMEKELKSFLTIDNKPYQLIALPMADVVMDNHCRLPATYANFLIINKAVLMPFYNSPKDAIAQECLQKAFPDREIVGINCLPLIKQHGSLHCVTMQFPKSIKFAAADSTA